MSDYLICPHCKNTQKQMGISVYRDMKATRECHACGGIWLPEKDDPESGGPYVVKGWFKVHRVPDDQTSRHTHDYQADEDYVVFTCKHPDCNKQIISERDGPDAD